MSLSTCEHCGGHIPLGPDATNRCERCGRSIFVPPEIMNSCAWEADEDGIWHAACDHASQNLYCFNDEGPKGNGFKFCPFCGRPLVEVKPIPASE